MRHGAHSSEIKADPNLIPLLDLVFQLIMFFMICVNFVSEQVNEEVLLPVAQSARPMDKGEVDVLFLNLDRYGKLLAAGHEKPLVTLGETKYYLRQQYADAKRNAQESGSAEKDPVRTAIIIRADRNVSWGQVYQLMQMCKDVGYRKLQLRAYYKAGG
jgi:biopolymer transport protein ExbD